VIFRINNHEFGLMVQICFWE